MKLKKQALGVENIHTYLKISDVQNLFIFVGDIMLIQQSGSDNFHNFAGLSADTFFEMNQRPRKKYSNQEQRNEDRTYSYWQMNCIQRK
jgi:hypothetical protein